MAEATQTGELRERLAELCHEQWSGWMEYLFDKGTFNHTDGTWTMPAEYVARWDRQLNTPYSKLSESEKDSDRKEADRILQVLFADFDNTMSSVMERTLHYVQCYHSHFPTSGAGWVADELKAEIAKEADD